MATDDDGERPLPPDDAFAVLGNDTRVEILRTLADASEPLAFSELRDRVGMRDSGQFHYHLDKLVDHFVSQSDDGYALRRAGERVIEAILSGAVTESPVIEPTAIDRPCPYCGAPIEVSYRQEWLARTCTECAGGVGKSADENDMLPAELEEGYLGGFMLPPAGVQGRTIAKVVETAEMWSFLEIFALNNDICPRCSGTVEHSIQVCTDHDVTDGLCDECGYRFAVMLDYTCTNCVCSLRNAAGTRVIVTTAFLSFVTAHGLNPHSPSRELHQVVASHDEEVVSTEPFEGRFTFTIDGDALTLTVDENLSVTAAEHQDRLDRLRVRIQRGAVVVGEQAVGSVSQEIGLSSRFLGVIPEGAGASATGPSEQRPGMTNADVVVVGAGVIGCASARHLAEAG